MNVIFILYHAILILSSTKCQIEGNFFMFKNKAPRGRNNVSGEMICQLRKKHIPKMSQRILAEKMQLMGIDLDKNAIQRIESGQRFVTDIELLAFSKIFGITCDALLQTAAED